MESNSYTLSWTVHATEPGHIIPYFTDEAARAKRQAKRLPDTILSTREKLAYLNITMVPGVHEAI